MKDISKELASGDYLAFFVEPRLQLSMEKLDLDFLKELKAICQKHDCALVVNDTGSLFSRYSEDSFLASELIEPDAGFAYLGGQMGLCYTTEDLYLSDPLMLISTWDGDEHSFSIFAEALKGFKASSKERFKKRAEFNKQLSAYLENCEIEDYFLEGGYGWINGEVPKPLRNCLKKVGSRYLVLPEDGEMTRALELLVS